MFKTFLLACAVLACAASARAQMSAAVEPACEERARRVLDALPQDNMLRHALESGQRGDCIHRPWMDELKRLGVKHVSFVIHYKITKKGASLKIGKVAYLTGYFQYVDHRLKDKRLLREIKESGLERRLREAVVEAEREWADGVLARVRAEGHDAGGYMDATLLDDEALPRVDLILD